MEIRTIPREELGGPGEGSGQFLGDVLITGGTGFFGHRFVSRLLTHKLSDRICIFSRDEFKQAQMRRRFQDDRRLRWFIGDVRDEGRLWRAAKGINTVIHAAALKRIEVGRYNPVEMVKTNVQGTVNVVEVCHDVGVRRAVYLSSDKAFEPISPYGQTKALGESIWLAGNETGGAAATRFVVTRYGNVSGSTGSVIPTWRTALEHGERIAMTDPDATRFWMYGSEAVDLVLMAAQRSYELANKVLVPVLPAFRLYDLFCALGGSPKDVDVTGMPAWEKMHESMAPNRCSSDAARMRIEDLTYALAHI